MKEMKLKPKAYFNLFLIIFFAAVIIGAMGYTHKARLIPLVVGLPCLAMAIAQFILDLGKGGRKGISGEEELFRGVMEKLIHQEIVTEDEEKKEKKDSGERKRFFQTIFWILSFVACLYVFGFSIAIPLFTILFMRYKREKWVLTLCTAAGLWVVIYVAFAIAAGLDLYPGLLIEIIRGTR